MRLLLISNSTNAGESYLDYPKQNIKNFLGDMRKVMFVPYAAVTFSFDEYQAKVAAVLSPLGIEVDSVHRYEDPAAAIRSAEAVMVGGGNTFHLVKMMQDKGVMAAIREKVTAGTPYIGWSAGSNVTCPTLCTTNDMPIVEPMSFKTLGLIPFQINPHYIDTHPEGHAGETRQQRIEEFLAANRGVVVAGLREGCMLLVEGDKMSLIGSRPLTLFAYGKPTVDYTSSDDLSFLLK